jgi:hypothetical protein
MTRVTSLLHFVNICVALRAVKAGYDITTHRSIALIAIDATETTLSDIHKTNAHHTQAK